MGKASNAKKTRAEKIAAVGYGKKPVNWFPIITSAVAVVLVAALGIFVFFGNQAAGEPSVAPTSDVTIPTDIATVIDQESGAINIGEADDVLEEYVDFGCPHCGTYHSNFGETVKSSVADGAITLSITPLGLLDNAFQGTEFSTRAANSFYCVAESAPNSLLTYSDNLFANQPAEGTKGLTDEELIKIAANSGATNVESCITDLTYGDFVAETTRKVTSNEWFKGTPTIRFNGEVIPSNTVGEVLAAL